MKKNISINISGIIFHIEEDGYESLKNYLESINNYFSHYEDSGEIVADIESRIAEIFLAKLKDGKQVITAADVQSLIATMGSIKDFEAVEETHNPYSKNENTDTGTSYTGPTQTKKLYRDTKRKIIGGVAAGIAHYFSIDPLWIRLILIILLFDLFISFSIGSIVLIGYIVCWIVIPPTDQIEEDKKVKKMFRNPDDRVLGGVAGGLAAYFGVDATLIRFIFVISIFLGGAGLVIYFILWIITPEAKSITDKMQMQGEPVTLSNIETNIKKSLNVGEGEEENLFVKILLFPFRLIAIIFSGLAKALGPLMLFLVEALRVIFGLFLILLSVVLLFCLFVTGGILVGLFTGGEYFVINDFPIDIISNSFPGFTVATAIVFLFVPFLALALLGVAILAKRRVVNPVVGWSMLAMWVLSIIGLSVTLPKIISNYSAEAIYKVSETYDIPGKTPVLTLREAGMENYQAATLTLEGHSNPEYKLVQNFNARGNSRLNAIENAKMVGYNVTLDDSVFIFDSNIHFKEGAEFRVQKLNMILYIPYNQPFQMRENLKHIIRNTIYRSGYSVSQMEGNTWQFTESGLDCITCAEEAFDESSDYGISESFQEFYFEGFTALEIDGDFEIYIREGDDFSVKLSGSEESIENVDLERKENTLQIDAGPDFPDNNDLKINIEMPELEDLTLRGSSISNIKGFSLKKLRLKLYQNARSEIEVDTEEIEIELTDNAELTLFGESGYMYSILKDNSKLKANEFEVEEAEVNSEDNSEADVNVIKSLKSNARDSSNIRNKSSQEGMLHNESHEEYLSAKALLVYYMSLTRLGINEANIDLKTLLGLE